MTIPEIPNEQKAAQYHRSDNALHINKIPVPEIAENDILVKTLCASLCRSDLMNFEANDIGLKLKDDKPVTLGHEAAGRVVRVGSKVSGFSVGDEVGFLPSTNCCYTCEGCQVHHMWCEQGCKMQGHAADGFFQEYIAIDHRNAMVLPAGLKAVDAAPLFCAGVTSYNGIRDCMVDGGLKAGDWLTVIGVGGLGHLGVQYAVAMGLRVIALDINDLQLEEAKACGASASFNTRTDASYIDKIKELTGGGCHGVVNFTNSAKSYEQAPSLLRINGVLMVVGLPQEGLHFNAMYIALRRFRVIGSSNKIPKYMPDCINFSVEHGIKSRIEHHRLEDLDDMIKGMQEGRFAGRVAVKFE